MKRVDYSGVGCGDWFVVGWGSNWKRWLRSWSRAHDNWFMVESVRSRMGMVGGQQYTTVYKLMNPITSAAWVHRIQFLCLNWIVSFQLNHNLHPRRRNTGNFQPRVISPTLLKAPFITCPSVYDGHKVIFTVHKQTMNNWLVIEGPWLRPRDPGPVPGASPLAALIYWP